MQAVPSGRRSDRHGRMRARLLVALVAATAALFGGPIQASASDPGDWLARVNLLRWTAGLGPVKENPTFSDGDAKHSRYMVANNLICHCEDPSLPYYTPEGAAAAMQSNILVGSFGQTAQDSVDRWMTGPFHGVGIIDPALKQTGFGSYSQLKPGYSYGAALNVIGGLGDLPLATGFPIYWPAEGSTVPLTTYGGSESPDPLSGCIGYSAPTGLPIIVQLGRNLSPSVTASSFSAGPQPLESCEFDGSNYSNPDASAQTLGRAVLAARGAVVIVPKRPLTMGYRYNASVTASGKTFSWSFNIGATSGPAAPQRPWPGGSDAVGISAAATRFYFAEGFTGDNFQEYLTVQNPGAAQQLNVQYFLASGATFSKDYQLDASSRTTIDVNDQLGYNQQVSAVLTAPNPFVAERPMYFNFPGGLKGGHDVMGATQLAQTFYFAEGYTGFQEYLTLLNPSASPANVKVTYFFNGGPPKSVAHPVGASSRLTVYIDDPAEAGSGREVSMTVSSDLPILAERPMYFNYRGKTGGHVVVGANTPSMHLNLAEGYVGPGFDEYLTILNPNPGDAILTITYLREGAPPVLQPLVVSGSSRRTVHVNDVLPQFTSSSVHVDSSLPVVVERPMYFTYGGGWTGGHDAVAVDDAALAKSFNFAEGYVGFNFAEYYTVLNPTPNPANLTFTYFLQGGATQTRAVTVPPNSRYTKDVSRDLGPGSANSVNIVSDQPVLAERPMYFSY